jgi:DNA-binding MarR family transcriptional regulator
VSRLTADPAKTGPSDADGARLALADYQALGAFRDALRKFLAFSEAGAADFGLTPVQHQALLAIKAFGGPEAMTVGQLATHLAIKSNSAAGLVKRLEEHRLVVRETSPDDRRRAHLKLTPSAERALEAISLSNLSQLKGSALVFQELLATLQGLGEHAPPDSRPGAQ